MLALVWNEARSSKHSQDSYIVVLRISDAAQLNDL